VPIISRPIIGQCLIATSQLSPDINTTLVKP